MDIIRKMDRQIFTGHGKAGQSEKIPGLYFMESGPARGIRPDHLHDRRPRKLCVDRRSNSGKISCGEKPVSVLSLCIEGKHGEYADGAVERKDVHGTEYLARTAGT